MKCSSINIAICNIGFNQLCAEEYLLNHTASHVAHGKVGISQVVWRSLVKVLYLQGSNNSLLNGRLALEARSIYLLVICIPFLMYGCVSVTHTQERGKSGLEKKPDILMESYTIGVDDQVQVNVWGNPELSVNVPVRPDGKITMPLIGDVKAAGKEPEEVADIIKEKLSTYIRNPNVTVILTALRSQEFISRIRVTGAVARSLSIPYRRGMTVLDAILEGGGITEFGAPNRTKLHRKEGSKLEVFDVRLEDIMEDGDLQTNLLLRPGDIITVPERLF